MSQCITAVETAFREMGLGQVVPPATMSVHVEGGAFHTKAGTLGRYFAAKSNGNFPANPHKHGLPTIQGVVLLCDATDGRVLAIMDSIELTARRTAAATAIAARHLARPDAAVVTLCGCGVQAVAQIDALREVLEIERLLVYDVDAERARAFAERVSANAVDDMSSATLQSDVIVTCTTSKEFFLYPEHVRPGTFIAAVGVDNESKKELAPALMKSAKIVTDVTSQCERIGDLHHAIDAAVLREEDVHGELPAIVAGQVIGRESNQEVIVFDSTGIGLQDVAAAAALYERAITEAASALLSVELSWNRTSYS